MEGAEEKEGAEVMEGAEEKIGDDDRSTMLSELAWSPILSFQ